MSRQDKLELRRTLAKNIKARMQAMSIESGQELARLAKVSQSMISTILATKSSPRVDTVQRIADALNCPAADLFQDDPENIPAMRDEVFLGMYAKYQLATPRDQELVKRILFG